MHSYLFKSFSCSIGPSLLMNSLSKFSVVQYSSLLSNGFTLLQEYIMYNSSLVQLLQFSRNFFSKLLFIKYFKYLSAVLLRSGIGCFGGSFLFSLRLVIVALDSAITMLAPCPAYFPQQTQFYKHKLSIWFIWIFFIELIGPCKAHQMFSEQSLRRN